MKRAFISFWILVGMSSGLLFANSLDLTKVKTTWTAYKAADKQPVTGTFTDIKYTFGKDTKSIAKTLEGATAVIKAVSADLGDDLRNGNIRGYFFSKLKGNGEIKVTLRNVVLGENVGSALATVNLNGKSQRIPIVIDIKDGELKAWGTIDILAFGAKEALMALAAQCFDYHEGMTWSQVQIAFTAPVK